MIEELAGDKRRQATASIRGYVYQAYQSVLAWMRLVQLGGNASAVCHAERSEASQETLR